MRHRRHRSRLCWRFVALALLGICLVLPGCAPTSSFRGQTSPLVYDQASVARADTLLFLIPGALTSTDIFDPVRQRPFQSYAPVSYRFPGFDGLPADHALGIDDAAMQIAAFANRFPDKAVRLIGYSTGGAIAILAAAKIRSDDVRIAALSPAVPQAGGLATGVRVSTDVLGSALRVGMRGREAVWLDYYRTLLFGRQGRRNPALADRTNTLVVQKKATLVLPGSDVVRAHSRDLRRWTLPRDISLASPRIRFFIGLADPVFSTAQTTRLSRQLGGVRVIGYPGDGHLLFRTRKSVFDDILAFFEAEAPTDSDP